MVLSVVELLEVSVRLGQIRLSALNAFWDFSLRLHTVYLPLFDSYRKLGYKKSLRELWGRERLFLVGPWPLEVWLGPSGG